MEGREGRRRTASHRRDWRTKTYSSVSMKNTSVSGRPFTRCESRSSKLFFSSSMPSLLLIPSPILPSPNPLSGSSIAPHHQWPATQKLFTLDVIYLYDKPGPDNCPQKVYDGLVDVLEQVSEYKAYIFEGGQGLTRVLFRHMCLLLSHPQQRCVQDDIDIPKSLTKKPIAVDPAPADQECVPVSSQ